MQIYLKRFLIISTLYNINVFFGLDIIIKLLYCLVKRYLIFNIIALAAILSL